MISNNVNDKKYIGVTKQFDLRVKQHLRALKGNYHHNSELSNDFLLYNMEYINRGDEGL